MIFYYVAEKNNPCTSSTPKNPLMPPTTLLRISLANAIIFQAKADHNYGWTKWMCGTLILPSKQLIPVQNMPLLFFAGNKNKLKMLLSWYAWYEPNVGRQSCFFLLFRSNLLPYMFRTVPLFHNN